MTASEQLRFSGVCDTPPVIHKPFGDTRFDPTAYRVGQVPVSKLKPIMRWGHYTEGVGKPGFSVALFRDGQIVGGCVFAQPSGRLVAPSLWRGGDEWNTRELSRLYLADGTGRNAESWFLSRALRLVPHTVRMVVAYSAPAFGHYGGCYQAANWLYLGVSTSLAPNSYHYRDREGRYMNKRRPWDYGKAHGLTEKKIVELWGLTRVDEPKKHVYVWPRDRRAKSALLRPVAPYPKPDLESTGGATIRTEAKPA